MVSTWMGDLSLVSHPETMQTQYCLTSANKCLTRPGFKQLTVSCGGLG